MATELHILGWEAEGLRCPDHSVDFQRRPNECFRISLIQMPNGTGKTTTLKLLRAALCGVPEEGEWTPELVRQLAKRHGDDSGRFVLRLLYDGRRLTIVLRFDFDAGRAEYATTVGDGMREGFDPPRELRRFLNKQFVRFFVFDGELAEQLLDRRHTDAESAVENLFQLNVVESMSGAMERYWDEKTMPRGAKETRGLVRRRNRVKKLRERLDAVQRERATVAKEHVRLSAELAAKRQRFDRELREQQELGAKVAVAEASAERATEATKRLSGNLLAEFRDPQALTEQFGEQMLALKENLDRAKLPASTAREFFAELSREDDCVCGRPLDSRARETIRQRASRYLSSESTALLNALKVEVGSATGADPGSAARQLEDAVAKLTESIKAEMDAVTTLEDVRREGISRNPELEHETDAMDTLQAQVDDLQRQLERYDDPSDYRLADDQTLGLAVVERRYQDATRKLAEITDTLALRAKRDVLDEVFSRTRELARSSISEEICRQANERIAKLMPENDIRVQSIERCLVLEGQEGGSVGETLSVGYAFLATLFEGGDHKLPFVVDSPANPIDLKVRGRVAELIPHLSMQLVAFTISSEREGFLDSLEAIAGEEIQYMTLFRAGSSEAGSGTVSADRVHQTEDGVLVQDGEFFRTFHLDQETGADAI